MLSSFWDRYAFSIGNADFQSIDVALAAMARGDWPAFERRLAEGLACMARAESEGTDPEVDAVDAAATAFRYERDLIAGSELTAWLDRMALSTDDWLAYLSRQLLRQQWASELDEIFDAHAPSTRDLAAAAVAEGVCSGTFDAFERTFAARAALVYASDPAQLESACRRADGDPLFDGPAAQLVKTHSHWLAMLPAADATARASTILRLESAFATLANSIACEARLNEIVEANRLEWIRVEFDTLVFPTESAAREAILCVDLDGLSLHDVAGLSHRSVSRSSLVLEDTAPDLRNELLSSDPGRLLSPHAVDEGFEVTRIVNRFAPALTDPVVASRARQTLIDLALAHAARDHVTRRTA